MMLSRNPYRLSTSHSRKFWRRRGTSVMRRVATRANTISADRDDPGDDHRVGDRETERPRDLDGLLRQPVSPAAGRRPRAPSCVATDAHRRPARRRSTLASLASASRGRRGRESARRAVATHERTQTVGRSDRCESRSVRPRQHVACHSGCGRDRLASGRLALPPISRTFSVVPESRPPHAGSLRRRSGTAPVQVRRGASGHGRRARDAASQERRLSSVWLLTAHRSAAASATSPVRAARDVHGDGRRRRRPAAATATAPITVTVDRTDVAGGGGGAGGGVQAGRRGGPAQGAGRRAADRLDQARPPARRRRRGSRSSGRPTTAGC